MADALTTAQGKPESSLRAILIGTRAPAARGWWIDLLAGGSEGSTHVTDVHCEDLDRWDRAAEIRRCNPLMWRYAESRAVLLEERDKARRDPRLKARFLSYRLNVPSADESKVLLTVQDLAGRRSARRRSPDRAPNRRRRLRRREGVVCRVRFVAVRPRRSSGRGSRTADPRGPGTTRPRARRDVRTARGRRRPAARGRSAGSARSTGGRSHPRVGARCHRLRSVSP